MIRPTNARFDDPGVTAQIVAVVSAVDDPVARMATFAAALFQNDARLSWAGFYLRQPDGSLLVGPYQGPVACHRLPPGRGVCSEAIEQGRSCLVGDVRQHGDHIACDPLARAELVIPLPARPGARPPGVLDLDSHTPNAFLPKDAAALESLLAALFPAPNR